MIGSYADIVRKVENLARDFDFILSEDQQFLARLDGPHDWQIAIEGDKVSYPAFSLLLIQDRPRDRKVVYSVAKLMQAVDERQGHAPRKPSLDNQLQFLSSHLKNVISSEDWLNDLKLPR